MLSILKSFRLFMGLIVLVAFTITGCGEKPKAEEPTDSSAVVQETEQMEEPMAEAAEEPAAPTEDMSSHDMDMGKSNHVVVKGESLWKISEQGEVYNDPFQWPVIYKANRDQIKDPDLIYPDQNFSIPRDATQQEIDDAVHEAKTRGPWSLWDGK